MTEKTSFISLIFYDSFSDDHLFGPHYNVELYKIPNTSKYHNLITERLEEIVPLLKNAKVNDR